MKVMLIRPNPGNEIYASTPPIGIGYIATNLRKIGIEPEVWDLALGSRVLRDFKKRVESGPTPDVVAIQIYSRHIERVKAFLDDLTPKLSKKTLVVVGGPHATVATKHALEYLSRADFACVGEADRSFPALIKQFKENGLAQKSEIKGLAWLENGNLKANPQDFPPDLDELGRPAWDLIPPTSYRAEALGGFIKKVPAGVMATSRGCPFKCTFCSSRSLDGHVIRKHSIAHVLDEIRFLNVEYGRKEIKIIDDNFTVGRQYVLDFCEAFRSSGLDVVISMPCGFHISTLDDEVLDNLKSIGVYNVPVALESGSQRIVDAMKKNINLEEAEEKIEAVAKKGFDVTCFFIIGYPGETLDDLKKTLRLALRLPLVRAHFNSFCPFPGTEIYEQLKGEGKIRDVPWHLQHWETVNYSFTDGVSRAAFSRWRIWTLVRFYVLRPKHGYKLLAQVRSKSQFFFLLKKGLEFLGIWKLVEFFA